MALVANTPSAAARRAPRREPRHGAHNGGPGEARAGDPRDGRRTARPRHRDPDGTKIAAAAAAVDDPPTAPTTHRRPAYRRQPTRGRTRPARSAGRPRRRAPRRPPRRRPANSADRREPPEVVIHATADLLAATTAARLVTKLVDIQSTGPDPGCRADRRRRRHQVLAHLNDSPARDAVDWSRVEIFWGDERFVPSADPERNEKQAREALLDHVPVDPARVHAMAASDGEFGDDVDAAAAAYADIVDGRDGLDLVMLGMGDEGHVASIFPESPAVYDTRSVVAVRNCPKPPPTRISLTLPTIRRASRGVDHHRGREQGRCGRDGPRRGRRGGAAGRRRDRPVTDAVAAGPAIGVRAARRDLRVGVDRSILRRFATRP